MREILDDVAAWQAAGKGVAVATVVRTWGSAPRPLASKMAVSADGEMSGSVSGGCVEVAVIEEALGVIQRRQPKLVGFGVRNEDAWAMGLSCGGKIEVFLQPLSGAGETPAEEDPASALFAHAAETVRADRLFALATVVDGAGLGRQLLLRPQGEALGGLGEAEADRAAAEQAEEAFTSFQSSRFPVETTDGAAEVFLEVHAPRPKMIVIGAVHTAIALVHFARRLGFETRVIDPRRAFATAERFAHADALMASWPQQALAEVTVDEATYFVLLAHDLKIELPALEIALASPARYIGALGSKKTHAKRLAALAEAGFDEAACRRIHAPIGLDLGGRKPEEIALATIAEIVAVSHGIGLRPAST